jgi:hypothetical protein
LSTYKISKIGLSWMKETLDFSFWLLQMLLRILLWKKNQIMN